MQPENKGNGTFGAKVIGSIGSALLVAIIGFFVWLANIASRVSVIEQTNAIEREAKLQADRERLDAARRVDDASREALARIEHEREANDARVRDDLREIRSKVFK